MIFDGRWKLIAVEGQRPLLYDLETDPKELCDIGASPDHADQITRLREMMFAWARRQHNRVAISDDKIDTTLCRDDADYGVYLGFWDEDERDAWIAKKESS